MKKIKKRESSFKNINYSNSYKLLNNYTFCFFPIHSNVKRNSKIKIKEELLLSNVVENNYLTIFALASEIKKFISNYSSIYTSVDIFNY